MSRELRVKFNVTPLVAGSEPELPDWILHLIGEMEGRLSDIVNDCVEER